MFVEKDKTILKSLELVPLKRISSIRIGDEMYFETLAEQEHSGMESLVFDEKLSCCNHGVLMVARVSEEFCNEHFFDTIYVGIAYSGRDDLSKTCEMLKTYFTGKYYSNTKKVDKELGCDTASFSVTVDGRRSNEFHTGADGYYGHAEKFKQYYGASIELSFDGDLFDEKELKDEFAGYLLKEDKGPYFTPEALEDIKNAIVEHFKELGGKVELESKEEEKEGFEEHSL